LHDARPVDGTGREDCREVEVVRDEDEMVPVRPRQNLVVGAVAAPRVDQWIASSPWCARRSTQAGDRFMSTSSFTAGAGKLRLPPPATRVGQGLGDVVGFKIRVLAKNLFARAAGSHEADDGSNRDTHAPDARLPPPLRGGHE
jgi:hypothetical protein